MYVVQTSAKGCRNGVILMTTDPGDLVLDPTLRFRHHRVRLLSNAAGAGSPSTRLV